MKKVFLALMILASVSAFASPVDVNKKVMAAFNRTFTDVQDVSWNEVADYYEVRFKQNDVLTKVTYNTEGDVVRTIRYYGAAQLPILVLSNIKTRFSTQKIFGVTEVYTEEGTTYQIILEDEHNWYHVNADSAGNVKLEDKFNKA
jgi:hypothetical protein